MLGAIIGDIAGSRFEWHRIKSKDFELLPHSGGCKFTDDSVMTCAIAKAILECDENYENLGKKTIQYMQELGRRYPNAGYGGRFRLWLKDTNPKPYNSFGNGSAMRVSPCGFAARSLEEAIKLSRKVTEVTHNHPEGIKGAEATAVAIYMAHHGKSIVEIRDYINEYYYPMDFTIDSIRETYRFTELCQNTVPQAIMSFLESTGYEDTIRNAVSLGGDADTLAAIAGGIAEAYYGIPDNIRNQGMTFLDDYLTDIVNAFIDKYMK